MRQHEQAGQIVQFGLFEVDLQEERLTKGGIRIRLQGQPFQILALLLEHPGQLVTRDDIRQRLWAQETFVEFDDALNTAVRKLRSALGDVADNPRFVETVPRRGYRFLAPVSLLEPPVRPAAMSHSLQNNQGADTDLTEPEAKEAFRASETARMNDSAVMAAVVRGPEGYASLPLTQPRSTERAHSAGKRRALLWLAMIAVGVSAASVYWRVHHRTFRLTNRDTVVIADFVNTTGEPVFDDALREGLEIGLAESPHMTILADRKASLILKQMGHSPEERISGRVAVEVCQRASGKVTVQGQISSLGTAYLVGLAAIRCDNGEPVANEQVQAKRREDVVDALGKASARLRSRLGESLPSIQKYNAPLEQATTTSLDALNAYGLALSTWDKKGDKASLPWFEKAVQLDPNFAQAYGALATIYHNVGRTDLARQNAAKAYELRSQVTEAERGNIEARYYAYVTGELDKTADVRAREVKDYPDSAGAYNHLGNVEGELGHYEVSTDNLRHAIALDPTRASSYANLAFGLIALNRVDEAASLLAEADRRKLQSDGVLQAEYWVAFLRGDRPKMKAMVDGSTNNRTLEPILLSEQANTEAYAGHFEESSELSRRAADLLEKQGDKESAATMLAQAAVRDVLIGRTARAREFLSQASHLSQGQDELTLNALCLAGLGDAKQAAVLAQRLNDEWPVGTYVQKYWLPVIRAQGYVQHGAPGKALDELRDLTPPFEFTSPPPWQIGTLLPAYLRGRANLAIGQAKPAQQEFQKFIDNTGVQINSPLGPMTRVWLARAYAKSGEKQKARGAYDEFFKIWATADPDIPILLEAKAEYAKLK